MDINAFRNDVGRRMQGAIDVLHKEFGGLRTGRASISLLEPIIVDAYGAEMPISQVATLGVPEPRLLSAQVWDRSLVKAVEKAIRDSGLGLNPSVDGQMLRIPVPPLTEERRHELTRVAARYAEEARVSIRAVRRNGMEDLKRAEKQGEISQDEHRDYSKLVQDETDAYVAKVDEALAQKDKDIMQV